MRTITDHMIDPSNDALRVTATDEPGHGGANHRYVITSADAANGSAVLAHIFFQNGTIPECGVNGVTLESLLAVCADRLRGFQSGQFACRENQLALDHIEIGLHWLQSRTRDRRAWGVEGAHVK